MAVNRITPRFSYGIGDNLVQLPPLPIVSVRAPTTDDRAELGTMWIDTTGNDIYVILETVAGVSSWVAIGSGAPVVDSLTVTNNLTVTLGNVLVSAGDLTVTLGDVLISAGTLTLTALSTAGVLFNTAAGLVQSNTGTNGQVIIGRTAGGGPAFATITSADATVVFTPGANTLDLSVPAVPAGPTFTFDDLTTAAPALGIINLTDGTNITMTATAADTFSVSVAAAPTFAGLVTAQAGISQTAGTATIVSNTNAVEAIYLHANAGIGETIRIRSDQGTSATSIDIESDAGGISLVSALNTDNAFVINSSAGGIDIDGAMQINIQTSEGDADSMVFTSAGGIDILANGATDNIDITSTGGSVYVTATEDIAQNIYLHSNGGVSETIDIHSDLGTGVNSINLHSDVGGLTLTATGFANANAINLEAVAGGIDMDSALQTNITSSQVAADAIRILASAGASGIDIDAGTDGIALDSTGLISLGAAAASDFTVTGAFDLTLQSTAGSVAILSGEAAMADSVLIHASAADGGVTIRSGTSGILIGSDADTTLVSIGDVVPTVARTITVGGGAVATAIADTIDIGPDGANTDAGASKVVNVNTGGVTLATVTTNIGSGTVTSGTHTTNIASGNRAAGTHALNFMTGTGTKTANLGNADGLTTLNIDAITLINDSINVNTSINTGTSTGAVAIGNALAGAITADTAANVSIDAATASNFTVSAAGADLTLSSTLGSTIVSAGEAVANAVQITASNAAGGVVIAGGTGATGGNILLTPQTQASAGGGAVTATCNAKVGYCTFAGVVTASGAQETFTITNSEVSATSAILVTVSNLGANDCRLSLEQVKPAAGTFEVMTQNNGGAACNGDVYIMFMVLS